MQYSLDKEKNDICNPKYGLTVNNTQQSVYNP